MSTMNQAPSSGAIVAKAAPLSSAGGAAALATRDVLTAWPRCAQLAAACLIGAAVALLGTHWYGMLQSSTQPAAVEGAQPLGYRVELNTATRGELLQLPGVGPALAERIEEYRRVHGGFTQVDELLKVSGIGTATLERLRPLVYVRPLPKADAGPDKPLETIPKQSAAKKAKKEAPPAELIDVNTASLAELRKLPGIGPKKAQNIIDARMKKPFTSVDDLRRVPGIGPKTFEAIQPLVTVGGAPPVVGQQSAKR
jgi:competence protein ComEA